MSVFFLARKPSRHYSREDEHLTRRLEEEKKDGKDSASRPQESTAVTKPTDHRP